MLNFKTSQQIFKSPFSKGYWQCACRETSSLFMLVFAANITAIRIILRVFSIPFPFADNLYFSFDFLFNALGSLIYGPILAIITGAITDTLAYMVFPRGPYYFPFTVLEMLSSFVFALFFYRVKISIFKILASKLFINIFINIICNSFILSIMYGKAILIYFIPRAIKNILIFPVEAFCLTVFLVATVPIAQRFGLAPLKVYNKGYLKIKKNHIILFLVCIIISIAISYLYYISILNT